MIVLDFETASEADLKALTSLGYAQHPSTQVVCCGFLDTRSGETHMHRRGNAALPPWLLVKLKDPSLPVVAHNAEFDANIWEFVAAARLGWPVLPLSRWVCTVKRAVLANLPGKLESLGKALGLTEQKDVSGGAEMLQYCRLQPGQPLAIPPDAQERIERYCLQDVVTTAEALRVLPKPTIGEVEVQIVDAVINRRGVAVDLPLLQAFARCADARGKDLAALVQDRAGFAPTQTKKLGDFLREHGFPPPTVRRANGSESESVNAETIAGLLEREDLPPAVRDILEARTEAAKLASIGKLRKIASVAVGGRVHNAFFYAEQVTGRWSSRGVQLHNLAKTPKAFVPLAEGFAEGCRQGDYRTVGFFYPLLNGISHSLRRLFIAGPGQRLFAADYSAIEARGLAWLAGEDEVLAAFSDPSRDVYTEDAASIGSRIRNLGKIRVLSLGYGMGAKAYAMRKAAWKLPVDLKECVREVKQWRETRHRTVQLWRDLENACLRAVREGVTLTVGRLRIAATPRCLAIRLPSGRDIRYWRPRIRETEKEIEFLDAEGNLTTKTMRSDTLTYYVGRRGFMEPDDTYGGKLAENVTQALCRDILGAALVRLHRNGEFSPVLHVHDSIASERPIDGGEGGALERYIALLTTVPAWASGFPIAAEGYHDHRFRG